MYRRLRILCALIVSIAALAFPTSAHAGDYWAYLGTDNGQPALACGVNSFACYSYGGPYMVGGSSVSAYPGSYIAGSYGIVRFNVPAGMVVLEGIADGTLATPNACWRLIVERPGGTPDYNSVFQKTSSGSAAWSAGWGVIPSYIDFQLETTCAATATNTNHHFWLNDFKVKLRDSSAPGLAVLSGANAAGWRGPGCHALRYAWSDSGSQMWTTYLHNLSTNQGIHSWTAAPGQTVVTSGVPTADFTPCVSAPGTGTYSYRVAGMDMSGNWNSYDFPISFDVTAPAVGAPQYGGTAVNDGRVFTGAHHGYKPEITWTASDGHSGVASVVTRVNGAVVPNTFAGGVVTLKPANKLPLGTSPLQIVVTDNVGNQTTVNRSIVVADQTPPTLVVSAPVANGNNFPVLDVTASDDYSGVSASTWKVFVNGVQLAAASGSSQLQASIGELVNGTHAIRVHIKDVAGNEYIQTINHIASSNAYTPPGNTGLFVLGSPTVVDEKIEYHVTAIAAKDGRPVKTGRFEITKVGGDNTVIAGKQSGPDGYVDMLATFTEAGPMQITLTGSQLAPAQFTYTYRKAGEPAFCAAHPTHTSCQTTVGGGGSSGGTGTTGGTGGTGTVGGGGVSIATSGGGLDDHVAPVFKAGLVRTKPGQLLRAKRIPIKLTSNERATFTIAPVGSAATRAAFTKAQTRVVKVRVTGALLKRLRAAKGKPITVRIKFTAVDGNKNVRRKTQTLRIRG